MPAITTQSGASIRQRPRARVARIAACLLIIPFNTQAQTREQTHWSEIEALAGPARSTKDFNEHFKLTLERKQHLLQRVQLYQSLYPGGARRDRAIQLELETLFEIGCLRGGMFDDLCKRAAEIQAQPPTAIAEQEAAFWLLRCEQLDRPIAGSQPSTARRSASGAHPLKAYRAFVRRFPASRHTPRLSIALFDDAFARNDSAAMRQVVDRLSANFPSQQISQRLNARLRRAEAIGRTFEWSFDISGGQTLELDSLHGRPVLIVVWQSSNDKSLQRLQKIEHFRSRYPNTQVIGVSLDRDPAATLATCQKLAIEWPQHQDGLGSAGAFVRAWAVERVPFCFVLDRDGKLLGASDDQRWRTWAEQAVKH